MGKHDVDSVDLDEEVVMANPTIKNMLQFSDTFTYVLNGEYRIRIEGGQLKSVTRKIKSRKRRKKYE